MEQSMTKLSPVERIFVSVLCTIEQMIVLAVTVWLVGWHGWNPWWFLPAMLLVAGSAPSVIIPILEK